jgi:hypothetical protein
VADQAIANLEVDQQEHAHHPPEDLERDERDHGQQPRAKHAAQLQPLRVFSHDLIGWFQPIDSLRHLPHHHQVDDRRGNRARVIEADEQAEWDQALERCERPAQDAERFERRVRQRKSPSAVRDRSRSHWRSAVRPGCAGVPGRARRAAPANDRQQGEPSLCRPTRPSMSVSRRRPGV